jgi:hypothetical protein
LGKSPQPAINGHQTPTQKQQLLPKPLVEEEARALLPSSNLKKEYYNFPTADR